MTEAAGKTGPVRGWAARSRGERVRLVLAAIIGGLTVAFALLNLESVQVNWIFGTAQSPLILVILISLLIGSALGFALGRRSGRSAQRSASRSSDGHG